MRFNPPNLSMTEGAETFPRPDKTFLDLITARKHTHRHADTHKYTEHAKVCIKINSKCLNWKNHSPQDEGSGSSDFKTSLEIISVHCFGFFHFFRKP